MRYRCWFTAKDFLPIDAHSREMTENNNQEIGWPLFADNIEELMDKAVDEVTADETWGEDNWIFNFVEDEVA